MKMNSACPIVLAFLCFSVFAFAAESAQDPQPGGSESSAPVTQSVSPSADEPTAIQGSWRQAFEYIEELVIESQDQQFRFRTNVVAVVSTQGKLVTVQLKPNPSRQVTKKGDPPPGRVRLESADLEPIEWPVPPLVVRFEFAPAEEGNVSVSGVSDALAAEAWAILNQGPATNSLRSETTIPYEIALVSGGKTLTLQGEQSNGALEIDWTLGPRGQATVGKGGWELPMQFRLRELRYRVGKGEILLVAESDLRYSSVRIGPEDKTSLKTRLTFIEGEQRVSYERTCELRPAPWLLDDETADADSGAARPAVKISAGGNAESWTRIGTLATLGVQRLTGVRETGLVMWVAQVAADGARSKNMPRMEDSQLAETFKAAGRRFPMPDPSAIYEPAGLWRGAGIRAGILVPGSSSGVEFNAGPMAAFFWRPLSPRRALGVEVELGFAQLAAGDGSSGIVTGAAFGMWNAVRRRSSTLYLFGGGGLLVESAEQSGATDSALLGTVSAGAGWRFARRFDLRATYSRLLGSDNLNVDSLSSVALGITF